MTGEDLSHVTLRDARIANCDECGLRSNIALTSRGWLCHRCIDGDLLDELLDLYH